MMLQIQKDYEMIKLIDEQFLKHCTESIEENKNNQAVVNAIRKSLNKYFYIKKIITKAYTTNQSYYQILKDKQNREKYYQGKKKINHKSTFYDYLNKLRSIGYWAEGKNVWRPIKKVFDEAINKPCLPIKPYNKYSVEQKQNIVDNYFEHQTPFKINKTNIWLKLRKKCDGFSKLSLKTVCHYINNDKRAMKLPNRAKIHHRLRKWNIDIGNIQMDVKVIGRKETKFKKYIYILDAKDEQSKLYWCKVLNTQTKQEMLEGLNEMINFYQGYGVKIKRVRTDNAMVFKKTNWVKSGEFDAILQSINIEHEFIPLGEPECNGVIERQHRILDEEVIRYIHKCENIEDFIKMMKSYQHYFNNERYHYYSFVKKSNEQYEIPADFVKKYLPLQQKQEKKQRIIN